MGATETIARWVVNTGYEDIPPDAIRVANESCFDLLGVILAGSVQPVGQIIQKYVAGQQAAPEATVLSGGGQSTLANAALANGTMGHALDYDDFGGFGHPTVAIFPALLAIGEHSGATGRDLLEAYVIGCEVGLALQHATKYKQMDRGFHATAVIGRLACAAACAKLMRLDERQTITALGIAGSMASGLIHNFGTMTKPLHAGLTGRDGITAAQLAQAGLTAGDQVVEHPFGFAATVLGPGLYDLDEMADNLGRPFRTQDALIIKKYPCCGGNHAMLDSLFSLMRDHDFTVDDVANAEIDQSYYSVVMLYQEPDDDLKGKFSAKYNVAAALVDGEVKIDTFTQEKIDTPVMAGAMDKVRTRVMAKSEELLTNSEDGLKVKITLKDGRVLEHTTSRAGILGSQQNPWGFDHIKAKFEENVALALSDDGVKEAAAAWSSIPDVSNIAELVQRTLVATRA